MILEEIESKIEDIGNYMIINRRKIAQAISDRSTESALRDIEKTLNEMVNGVRK